MALKIVDRRKRAAGVGHDWDGGVVTLRDGVTTALWLHRGRMVSQRPLDGLEAGAALRERLLAAPPKARPETVRVSAAHAAALEGAGPEVEVVAHGEVERVQRALDDEALLPRDEVPSFGQHGRVPRGLLHGLFEAAARFEAADPTKVISGLDAVRVRAPALGLETVWVNLSQQHDGGVAVLCFDDPDALRAFASPVNDDEVEDDDVAPPAWLINLVPQKSLLASLRAEVAQLALPVPGRLVPLVTVPATGGEAHATPPSRDAHAWAVLDALAWLAGRDEGAPASRFDMLSEQELSVAFVGATMPGQPRVEVTPEPMLLDRDDDGAKVQTEPEQRAEALWEASDQWLEAAVAAGRERSSLRALNIVVDELCAVLGDADADAPWEPSAMVTAWLDVVAADVPVRPAELAPGLDDAIAVLRSLAAEEDAPWAASLADAAAAAREAFAAREPGQHDEIVSVEVHYLAAFGDDED